MQEQPRVELLFWRECPSWEQAIAQLRERVGGAGLDPDRIELREVHSDEEAERERFVGSPTIRIDGEDVQDGGSEQPFGLTCRVYRLRDGRISPLPDPDDVREALEKALSPQTAPPAASPERSTE